MCANSPKNYTVSTVKLQMAKDVHSKVRGAPEAPGMFQEMILK